ncbi:MAG: hypothetical protein M1286_00530 [Candidatus Marsarchaeota archaeon]|nr:hypothetical protein [Candidatus Marsarchaeota archaeon]
MKEGKSGANNKNMLAYVGVLAVILVIAIVLLVAGGGRSPGSQTTTANNLTTMTIAGLTTTIVSNLTTATGPNLASCNGYGVSISQAYHRVVGSCSWTGGLVNVSLYGGAFQGTHLEIVQLNTTTTPFNESISAPQCASGGKVFNLPIGSYNVSFTTGIASGGGCGNATMRMATS